MSNSSINSAMSGLSAAQLALDTVGNNVANVNVSGYSRQHTVIDQANSSWRGMGWIGNGAQVTGVKREYNEFITRQLREAQTTSSQMTARYQQMSKVDDMLASQNSVSSSLQDFFASLQLLTSNADDPAARQTLLGKANALVNMFKVTDKYLTDQYQNVNTEITSTIAQINNYADQLANLNKRITQLAGIAGGTPPNDLLDQRDILVTQLNQLTNVRVLQQDNDSYTIFTANGYTLVQGGSSYKLAAVPAEADPGRIVVASVDSIAGNVEIPEDIFTGGALSGLLKFRAEDLDPVSNSVNQLAYVFADSFNKQHMAGVDIEGDAGGQFFNIGAPQVLSNSRNATPAPALSATIENTRDLQAMDYHLLFDGTHWKVSRSIDDAPVTIVTDPPAAGVAATSLTFDGLKITIAGVPNPNDKFIVKPVINAIKGMEVGIRDPSLVAMGTAGADNGPADNRNGQLLLDLQNKLVIAGGKSFNDAWAGVVSEVGDKTKVNKVTSDTQNSVVKQLVKQQQSVSGVNLDEEYGKLQYYQQYYMANAKALQTASTLFDALLAAIR